MRNLIRQLKCYFEDTRFIIDQRPLHYGQMLAERFVRYPDLSVGLSFRVALFERDVFKYPTFLKVQTNASYFVLVFHLSPNGSSG